MTWLFGGCMQDLWHQMGYALKWGDTVTHGSAGFVCLPKKIIRVCGGISKVQQNTNTIT